MCSNSVRPTNVNKYLINYCQVWRQQFHKLIHVFNDLQPILSHSTGTLEAFQFASIQKVIYATFILEIHSLWIYNLTVMSPSLLFTL